MMKKRRSAVRPQGISFGGGEGRGGGAGERSPGFYVCVRPSASLRKSDKKKMDLRCNILACLQMAEGNAQVASGSPPVHGNPVTPCH